MKRKQDILDALDEFGRIWRPYKHSEVFEGAAAEIRRLRKRLALLLRKNAAANGGEQASQSNEADR